MIIVCRTQNLYNVQKFNLFTPNPKGSKLIFFTPFRAGVNEENQFANELLNMIII
jgi:hypothetical protein